jgi:hypothetical protein
MTAQGNISWLDSRRYYDRPIWLAFVVASQLTGWLTALRRMLNEGHGREQGQDWFCALLYPGVLEKSELNYLKKNLPFN